MLTFQYWKTFLKTAQYGGGALGVLLNFTLLLLIIYRSPKHLGAYKYLMIYIAGFEMLYSILDAITEPHLFSHGPAFMIFRFFKHSYIGRKEGFFLMSLYACTFGISFALFGIHFIYRYGAADINFRKKYSGEKLKCLFLIPLVYGFLWFNLVFFMFPPSPASGELMRIPLLQGYDSRIEDITYVLFLFYSPNDMGELEPVWITFIGMACFWLMMSSSFFCVMFFGIKCYRKITKALKNSKMSSYYVRSIQQQLFQALVMQTLVPVVLMYVPIGILYIFPMLNIEVGFISSFATATIAIYPAVDPLPTMFIVESYRKALFCGCRNQNKTKREGATASVQN